MPEKELPETTKWQPRDASRSLAAAFEKECVDAEARIKHNLQQEKGFMIDNFDVGLKFESRVRRELSNLLPKRYKISNGLLTDRNGMTAGNCDILLYNDTWFAPIRSNASEDNGLHYIPIEGVYAVGEVKQSLSINTLDDAMEKVVTAQRLDRPETSAHRLVENREGSKCFHGLTNPLFSFILAGSLAPGADFQSIIRRFFEINKNLKRLEIVRSLCVLGEGVVSWCFIDPLSNNEIRPALFVADDLFHQIFPVFIPSSSRNSFYSLVDQISRDLFHAVLGPEDITFAYSALLKNISVPKDPEIVHQPDVEWLDKLSKNCSHDDLHR